MGSIVSMLLPILLPLLGRYIEKYFKGQEAEQYFLKMVNEINSMGGSSVKLSDDYMAALDRIRAGSSAEENAKGKG